MPYMCASYVCLICVPYMYAVYVCRICVRHRAHRRHHLLVCVPYVCAIHACRICISYMYAVYVYRIYRICSHTCMPYVYVAVCHACMWPFALYLCHAYVCHTYVCLTPYEYEHRCAEALSSTPGMPLARGVIGRLSHVHRSTAQTCQLLRIKALCVCVRSVCVCVIVCVCVRSVCVVCVCV